MTKKLNEQLTQDLLLIDPYYSQKKQSRIFKVSINKMMKFRKDAGLECKAKGRPIVQTKYKGEEELGKYTTGEDGKVTSTAIDATYATDFGFYLYPYGADPATLDPRDVVKESYVISSGGTFKGCVELTFHISIDTTP